VIGTFKLHGQLEDTEFEDLEELELLLEELKPLEELELILELELLLEELKPLEELELLLEELKPLEELEAKRGKELEASSELEDESIKLDFS